MGTLPTPPQVSPADWARAKGEVYAILVSTAVSRSMIHYGELARRITAIPLKHGGNSYNLTRLLGEVAIETNRAVGIHLTSIVVTMEHGHPSPEGYFPWMQRQFGLGDGSVNLRLWLDQVWATWTYYKNHAK